MSNDDDGGALLLMMMMMEEDERRRREEEEEEERRREEEERRREEERRMIEHRKYSPVICNDEDWQEDRCVKAFSMQSCVQDFVSLVEKERPKIIEIEENKYDEKLLEAGNKYEVLKTELQNSIETLKGLDIIVEGEQFELTRLASGSKIEEKPKKTTESFGNTFTIKNGPPIELNSKILGTNGYFEKRYNDTHQDEVEQKIEKTNVKIERYKKYGKHLGFLLKTKRYYNLEEKSEDLVAERENCELKKKEMESFNSLNIEQLKAIKDYLFHLIELKAVSLEIDNLFINRGLLKDKDNKEIYDLTVKDVIANEEYGDIVSKTHEYFNNMINNDEETMNEAYELVKGEYPISISRRYIYELIINNIKGYKKEKGKVKKLS